MRRNGKRKEHRDRQVEGTQGTDTWVKLTNRHEITVFDHLVAIVALLFIVFGWVFLSERPLPPIFLILLY
ncbi:MAG: hypothetical protein EBR81_13475 [Proteobacteria bacterium]|nr:hypothetical protein [Pseudomonadota bacterium]